MAKISEYRHYSENVPSGGSTAKFQATGVIPVSGKYTDNGDMETKNVLMSELLGGGGSELPPIGSGDTGKVLKVDGDSLVWGFVGDIEKVDAGDGLTGGGSAGSITLSISTAGASDGQVLTYNSTSGKVGWETPSGSGGGLTPVSVEVVHTSGKCTINVPSNNTFVTVTGLEKYASDTGYGIYIVPPTVASGELLNCVVEIIGGDGNDHWINVEGNYSALASPHDGPLMGYSPAHVTFLGQCFTIVTNGGGS